MSEQLKQAAALIKRGELGQASQVLRGILRQDPRSVEAWWMLSYTFDSPEKSLQALERALSLDPSHAPSNKRIARLRGEVPVAAESLPMRKPGAMSEQSVGYWDRCCWRIHESLCFCRGAPVCAPRATTWGSPLHRFANKVWDKLDNPPKPKRGAVARDASHMVMGNPWLLRIIVMIVLVAGGGVWTLFTGRAAQDSNGNTPTDVVRAFEEAYWVEDAATMRSLICPGYERYFDEVWSGTYTYAWGYNPVQDVDLSRMRTDQIRYTGDEATVAFHGVVTWTVEGERMTYDYDDEIAAQGGDVWIGHHVRRIDGVWMICDGPDTVYY